jgi:(p)ppGpp synthase/HD superfamily hydrolase
MLNYDEYIEFVKARHERQKRMQGTPYYLHPVAVSNILKENGFPLEYQIAGLFHDLIEDTNTTYDELLSISNSDIVEAVKLVTKEKGYNMKDYIDRISKNDMAKMVKLADRYHNLSETHLEPIEFQKRYIKDSEDWYLELAKNTVFEEKIKEELQKLKNNS